ncbi:hypothetical protein ANCCAN_29533, partial [Ancylostoma caninum]
QSTTQTTRVYTAPPTRPTTTTRRTTTTTSSTTTTPLLTTLPATTEAPTTTRVFITTSTIPDRWKTTEVVFGRPEKEEKPSTEFSSDQAQQEIEKSTNLPPPQPPAAQPTKVEEEIAMHREPQPTQTEQPKWSGQVEPAQKSEEEKEEEEETKPVVTTRPIHIVSLEGRSNIK